MIASNDRSGYFGASDSAKVMTANRNTKTWKAWWDEKLGGASTFKGNAFTYAGNLWEHSVLRAIDSNMNFDRQIILNTPRMLLRVNYDGNLDDSIFEIKTHKNDHEFEITNNYWMQAQVEMYAWKYASEHGRTDTDFFPVKELKEFHIVSYALNPEEVYSTDWITEDDAYYGNLDVDENRLKFHKVKYDKSWIKGEYLPRLKELTKALRKGKSPI